MDFEFFFRSSMLPLALSSPRGQLLRVNGAAAELLERTEAELAGHSLRELVAGGDVQSLNDVLHTARRAPGSAPATDLGLRLGSGERPVRLTALAPPPRYDEPTLLLHLEDRREVSILQERVAYLTGIDPMTGLANRLQLSRQLAQTIAAAGDTARFALLLLNVNRFQEINDSFGHDEGDRILAEVAGRIHACLPAGAYLARTNGVRFVIVAPGDEEAVKGLFARVARRVEALLAAGGDTLRITLRGGLCHYPRDGRTGDDLLRHAAAALHQVQDRSASGCCTYSPEIKRRSRTRLARATALARALERDQFVLHYQPLIDTARQAVTGVEALLRWQHPERGLVPPLDFLPALEDAGLGAATGSWVLEKVCDQARAWQLAAAGPLRIAINLMAGHFRAPRFSALLEQTLDRAGLQPDRLEVEVTEGLLLSDAAVSGRVLGELAELGVAVALDDFGTGYSSLPLLQSLPVQTLKIDRSFVGALPHDSEAARISEAIIVISRSLGLQVTAEGVETAEQLAFLHGLRCHRMQGFYFARPMPAPDLEAWLDRTDHRLNTYPPAGSP